MVPTIYHLEDDVYFIKTIKFTIEIFKTNFNYIPKNNLETYLETLKNIDKDSNPLFILDGKFPRFLNQTPQFLFPEALEITKEIFPNSIILHYSGSDPNILKERELKYQIPVFDKLKIDCLVLFDEITKKLK